jgi:hypothetical protein
MEPLLDKLSQQESVRKIFEMIRTCDKQSDKLARNKTARRFFIWSVCSIAIAFLWFFITAYVDLSTDDGNTKAHQFLDAASSFVNFPLSYLPGIESWNSQSYWMSLEVFQWYEIIGLYLNCLFWGFFLVWLFRLVVRRFTSKHTTHPRA